MNPLRDIFVSFVNKGADKLRGYIVKSVPLFLHYAKTGCHDAAQSM